MSEKEKKNSIIDSKSSRRTFIKNSGLTVGGLVLGGALGSLIGGKVETVTQTAVHDVSHEIPDYTQALQFFTRQKDFEALAAATEVIYPEDENGPGAIGLGVPYFIDKQLVGPWGTNAQEYRKTPYTGGATPLNRGEIFIQGLRKMNEISEKDYGDLFKSLDEETQIEILTKFQDGKIEMNKVSSTAFFTLLRQATLEGCFSDPVYGGNKNMAGWKMKEFPGAQMSYFNEVEEDFKVIEPISLGGHHS